MHDVAAWEDSAGYFEVAFLPPGGERAAAPPDPNAKTDEAVLDTVRTLVTEGAEPTLRAIRARSPYGNEKTADALTRLTLAGQLTEATGSRAARIFHLSGPPATGSGSGPKGPGTGPDQSQPVRTGSETSQDQSEPDERGVTVDD